MAIYTTRYNGECPKCSSKATWLEFESLSNITHCCLCGLNRLVQTATEDGILIYHSDKPKKTYMPRKGTDLRECLQLIANDHPTTTTKMSVKLGWSTKKTSTNLTVLRINGFVESLTKGSWTLSSAGKEILKTSGLVPEQ